MEGNPIYDVKLFAILLDWTEKDVTEYTQTNY